MKPLDVVNQIIDHYKPYAIGAAILGIIWLFIFAKVKKQVRIRKLQRQENERNEARMRNREGREIQSTRIQKQKNKVK